MAQNSKRVKHHSLEFKVNHHESEDEGFDVMDLNILKGLLLMIFSNILSEKTNGVITRELFIFKVNEYMQENRLEKIPVATIEEGIKSMIEDGLISSSFIKGMLTYPKSG